MRLIDSYDDESYDNEGNNDSYDDDGKNDCDWWLEEWYCEDFIKILSTIMIIITYFILP